mgnify:CR=1 FL=1
MASMYAVYHGPKGLRQIAKEIHSKTISLKSALENAEKIPNKRVNKGLKEDVEKAKLSKKLATIHTNVELDLDMEDFKVKKLQSKQ